MNSGVSENLIYNIIKPIWTLNIFKVNYFCTAILKDNPYNSVRTNIDSIFISYRRKIIVEFAYTFNNTSKPKNATL